MNELINVNILTFAYYGGSWQVWTKTLIHGCGPCLNLCNDFSAEIETFVSMKIELWKCEEWFQTCVILCPPLFQQNLSYGIMNEELERIYKVAVVA